MNEQSEPHLLAGAYVLNSLDEQERAEYEQFLAGSEEARAEVAGMSDTAVLLGLASRPVTPSPQLKANLMALISTTAQLPPLSDTARPVAVPEQSSAAPGEGGRSDEPTAPVQPIAPVHPTASDQPRQIPTDDEQRAIRSIAEGRPAAPSRPAEARAEARWFQRGVGTLLAAAAAVALVVGGIGGTLIGLSLNSDERAMAELSAAEDLRQTAAPVEGGGTATLIGSDDLRRSAILADGLPELGSDEIYQMWYIDDAGATSAGTFAMPDTGTTMRLLEGTRDTGDLIGLTVEPAGGSETPTSDPIVVIDA